jgi:hypothetical protein
MLRSRKMAEEMIPQIARPEAPQRPPEPAQTKIAPAAPSLRHSLKCAMCRHPHRFWIEMKFRRWHSPELIAREFDINDRKTIYRHAHACHRLRKVKVHCGRVIEQCEYKPESRIVIVAAAAELDRYAQAEAAGIGPSIKSSNKILRRVLKNRPK